MNPGCSIIPTQPQRRKEPNDGPGPRGFPDCYYKSRVLNSTFRYVRFVKKLRAIEEEQRKGQINTLKELKDKQICDFFIRCDRRSLVNNVARRVDLCLKSYEVDLEVKKKKLIELLKKEEEDDIRNFVIQVQAGAENIWREKMERLQYLLEKRRKEHEEKYKDTPLSKCVHVLPCIYKLRAKEAQQIQLYQMKEKQAMHEAEREFDRMWHEVAMKESDALAARMEQDAIERYRRDLECKEYSDTIMEARRQQRERDREMLKQEQMMLKAKFEDDRLKEEQEEEARKKKRMETAKERADTIAQRKEMLAKQMADEKVIAEAWDSLQGQGLADEQAKIQLMKRKEKELDICNSKMIELRDALNRRATDNDDLIHEEGQRRQDAMDRKRCQYLLWSHKTNADVRKAMVDQIKEKKLSNAELQKKMKEQEDYHKQLFEKEQVLVDRKAKEIADAKKKHQQDLISQIQYNKLLKERARQDELDQIKKGQIAAKEYEEEIKRMLCRPFFSDDIHPFMRQMAQGLKMKEKCPCAKPDYCA